MNFFRNPWAIVLLIVLVILLFGANKLPGLARNMGKSMRIFKSEVEEMRGDETARLSAPRARTTSPTAATELRAGTGQGRVPVPFCRAGRKLIRGE